MRWKARRCFVGGKPSSGPAMSKPQTPSSRKSTASWAIVSLSVGLAHGREDRAHDDAASFVRGLLDAEGEAVQHGAHDFVTR